MFRRSSAVPIFAPPRQAVLVRNAQAEPPKRGGADNQEQAKAQLDSLQEQRNALLASHEAKHERLEALQERLEEAREDAVREVLEALRERAPHGVSPHVAADFIEREFLARIEEESG